MTYATVVVGLSVDQPNEARLEIAGQLAERLGARVIGIAAAEFSPPLYFTSGEQAQKLVDRGRAAIKNRLAEVESEFRAAMQNRVTEVEWRCAEDFPSRYIVQQARASDIIVVGQAGRGIIADPFVQVSPSDLVMQAGRSLLVVSDACNWLDSRSVLVAWKDTTEARRAVADALPLLRKATDVTVVEIVEEQTNRPAALSRVKDVAAWLSRHGGKCIRTGARGVRRSGRATGEDSVGSRCRRLVAGAYGHSRLRDGSSAE
jgi:nucleotide-binding universal stress UspA family protein